MGTIELLVRTHFTLVAAVKGSNLKDVIGYGSGFMMLYRGYKFFVTAAHVNEPTWSVKSKVKKIMDNDVAIVTHIATTQGGVMQTLYIPIGNFVYINEIHIDPSKTDILKDIEASEQDPIPVDVAVAMVEERPGVFTFSDYLIPEDENEDWETKSKIIIPYDVVTGPDVDDHYFVYGRVKFDPRTDEYGTPYVYSEPKCHPDMEYVSTLEGNVHVFKATEDVIYDEWAGISGSPVLNPDGFVVGIASSVLEGFPHLFALDISVVRPLFDTLIMERENNNA